MSYERSRAPDVARVPFPATNRAPGAARAVIAHTLGSWGVPVDDVDAARLVVSELVTNAVVHAEPPKSIELEFSLSASTLRISVMDGGRREWSWPDVEALPSDEHGRGRTLLKSICKRLGVERLPGRTVVWCEIDVGGNGAKPRVA